MGREILEILGDVPGQVSFFYKNLITGEHMELGARLPHTAASLIKIPVMVEAFRRFELEPGLGERTRPLRDADRVPPCGVLTLLHTGLEVSLMDLVWLMITISDNMATNMLIDFLGIEAIQATSQALGLGDTRLRQAL